MSNKIPKVLIISLLIFNMACQNKSTTSENSSNENTETGIKFFKGNFKEAMAKAKAEQKMIFMDAYASWCGPCKVMKQGTFPDPLVGKVFNEKFVSLAYDMEVGEGLELTARYPVSAYPTLFFMDADGNILKSELGFRDPAGLIALANDLEIKK